MVFAFGKISEYGQAKGKRNTTLKGDILLTKDIKQMAKDDINFNLQGKATYSQAKAIIKICKIVYERAATKAS